MLPLPFQLLVNVKSGTNANYPTIFTINNHCDNQSLSILSSEMQQGALMIGYDRSVVVNAAGKTPLPNPGQYQISTEGRTL